jgi:hypothetical protein
VKSRINISYLLFPAVKLMEGLKAVIPSLKTWHVELTFVVLFHTIFNLLILGNFREFFVGIGPMVSGICLDQVQFRLDELEKERSEQGEAVLHCHMWRMRYYWLGQLSWIVYYVDHKAYTGLVAIAVLGFGYPAWRKAWRDHHPVKLRRL